jgi:type IV secretory pathway VirD2 relaxase
MLVRDALQARMYAHLDSGDAGAGARLPPSLRREHEGARTAMLRRLSASRVFALGQKSGALRTAQMRSGRPFRLDMRQRVIVKALVSRHVDAGAARAIALAKHVSYLGRSGAGHEGARPEFFDRDVDGLDARAATRGWGDDRHHFRFIISPEHGDRIYDLRDYVRDTMSRVAADLGEPKLDWLATCHFDTDQPHAHVLLRGRREDGRDLVIPRAYMGYGFRGRAQEAAQERLGDLSRHDAERRVWRETQANRFTGLDRRLIAAADSDLRVEDGVGHGDAWSALTRGRLRHLEGLGLATREGAQFRLDADLERKLRTLQIERDVIRTFNQRRLAGAEEVQMLGDKRVRGEVVRSGFHDELGATPYVVVRDAGGIEHYARLRLGASAPGLGSIVELAPTRGAAQVIERGRGLQGLGL